jgi:hypothetical protein
MAIDKGYGSGKSRSSADSRFRQRATAGQMTKGKKGAVATIKSQRAKQAASPVGQLADFAMGFLLPGKFAKKVSGNTLKWGPSVTFENPFKKALNAPKPPKELDWGPRALFVRTKPTKPKGELDWGRSLTVENPLKKKALKSYNSSQSTNYSLPLGLGIIGGAAVVGANAAKDNARKAAIKKASTKTRKGQTRGR